MGKNRRFWLIVRVRYDLHKHFFAKKMRLDKLYYLEKSLHYLCSIKWSKIVKLGEKMRAQLLLGSVRNWLQAFLYKGNADFYLYEEL